MVKIIDYKSSLNLTYDSDKIAITSGVGATLKKNASGTDQAIGITPTSGGVITNPTNMTDGDLNTYGYLAVSNQYAEIDLGALTYVKEIKLYHLVGAGNRKYNDVIVQVSADGLAWSTLFNTDKNNNAGEGIGTDNEYTETEAGKTIYAGNVQYQYIRVWGNGYNGLGNVTEIREIEVIESIYHTSNPTLKTIASNLFDVTEMLNIVETSIIAGSDGIQYTISVDGIEYYWTGSQFEVSDGSYTQTNDIATLVGHLGILFDAPKQVTVGFTAYLHSDTGATTPTLNNLNVSYDLHEANDDEKMKLYLEDLTPNIQVKMSLVMGKRSTPVYDNGNPIVLDINDRQIVAKADNNGYCELKVYANEDIGGNKLITSGVDVFDLYDCTIGDDLPVRIKVVYSSTAVNLASLIG